MKILLVEDDNRLSDVVKRGLEEHGNEVDWVADGEAAVQAALNNNYGMIVLDLMLPKLSGEEVLATLRRAHVETSILVLTAKDQLTDKVTVLTAGADDYMTKPFALEELLARIGVLERRHKLPDTGLSYSDLSLNLLTRQVFRGERELDVRPREFALLEFFIRRPEQPLSRHVISEHVWGSDYAAYSNVIDVHIRNIRKKLKKPELLHSVRGTGYILSMEPGK